MNGLAPRLAKADPPRFVQRIVAVHTHPAQTPVPQRYVLASGDPLGQVKSSDSEDSA